jgi:RNA polymerase sigma-70 factor, ECF subfamily
VTRSAEAAVAQAAVAEAFRDQWGRLVAALIRFTGDWDVAEESAQEALATALERWPKTGIPRNPGAWLMTTARNKAVDRMRREARGAAKLKEAAVVDKGDQPEGDPDGGGSFESSASGIEDDRLRLIFTCCHPALVSEAQVALTLRTLCGLSTAEIARAFIVPEQTMAQRLVRAKRKIKNAAIPYRVPPAHQLLERTGSVLAVIYLLYNEGYGATSGDDLVRVDLSSEAIRLGRTVADLMPDEPEALGLVALMLLQDSRRAARVDESGDLVTLEEQDRSRWDRSEIDEGLVWLGAADRRQRLGPYQVQARIAACHAVARQAAATDWIAIEKLYSELARFIASPVVMLNRAVAIGMAYGPEAGLEALEALASSGALDGYHLLPATRADLLRRAQRPAEAADAYGEALKMRSTAIERRYLERRLAEMTELAGTVRWNG